LTETVGERNVSYAALVRTFGLVQVGTFRGHWLRGNSVPGEVSARADEDQDDWAAVPKELTPWLTGVRRNKVKEEAKPEDTSRVAHSIAMAGVTASVTE